MQDKEIIKVYINYQDGKTVCICKRSNKRCNRHCEKDIVERDKFRGIEYLCKVDRYGKSKLRGD